MRNEIISPRMKQIEIAANGKIYRFEAFSWDGGKSYCSDPKATVEFLRRRKAVFETRLTEDEMRRIDLLESEFWSLSGSQTGSRQSGEFERRRHYMRAYSRGYRAAHGEGKPRELKTHCIRNHELTPENVRVYGESRYCKECQKIRMAAYQQKMKSLPPTEKQKRLQSDCSKQEVRHVA